MMLISLPAAASDIVLDIFGNANMDGFVNEDDIGYLAKLFHPEEFEDLDPKAIHQEYLTKFQGLDYDLGKEGVFVYPLQEE